MGGGRPNNGSHIESTPLTLGYKYRLPLTNESTHSSHTVMTSCFSATNTSKSLLPLGISSATIQLSFKDLPETGPGYYIDSIALGESVSANPDTAERCRRAVDHILTETSGVPFSLQKGTVIKGTFAGESTMSGLIAFDGEVSCLGPGTCG